MYYGILGIAVLLFSLQFYMNHRYQKDNGTSLGATMVFVCLSNLAGLIILLAVNGLHLTVTPFGLLMALVDTANNLLFLWCSSVRQDQSVVVFGFFYVGWYDLSLFGRVALLW